MRLSVVIPAFNEEKLLPSTLKALDDAAKALPAGGQWRHEVVVCDNNSSDATPTVAAAHGARVVFEPRNMIARARNTGATAARGDWLLFLDADSRPSGGLLADMARAADSGSVAGGGATLRMDRGNWLVHGMAGGWNLISRTRRWVAGSFIFVERTVFEGLGGFDTSLYAGEEIEFSKRLHRAARTSGRRVVILHRHPLVTSARKADLYRPAEIGRLLLRAALRPRRTLTDRDACALWYDGRR